MIAEHVKEIDRKYKEWEEKRLSNPKLPDAFDIVEAEIMNNSQFEKILYNSVFLAIYSMFEHEFTEICRLCQKEENYQSGPKNYLAGSKKYIMEVVGVNLDSLNDAWNKIQDYRRLRNSIAHRAGEVSDQETIRFVNSTDGVSINRLVTIDSIDFLKDFIDLTVNYLVGVCDEIVSQKN